MIDMNNLESLATEIGKDIKDIKTRYATKDEMHEATEIDYSQIVTHEELEGKHYLTEHQNISHLATKAEVVTKLDKIDFDLLKRDAVTRNELDSKHYLTEHQSLAEYAKKSEIVTPQLTLTGNTLGIVGGNRVTLPLPENAGNEIRGTGIPEGRISAEIGATYVDTAVTNGALKWIKEKGNNNTGWRVLIGDTGWRTLPVINKRGNAKVQVRRINDEIVVKFDGLSWGWFGVDDMDKQERAKNISDKTVSGKKYTWIRLYTGRGNNVLPEGFRSASSLLSGLYGDLGDLLGSVYVGGTADSNAIQLRYAMERNELTSTILSQIRISPVVFTTDDPWPTTLP